jgi:hypothetical protein
MKYIAIINSDEPLTEHMIQEIKDTAFCGDDQTPYVFDIEKILDMAEVPRWIPVSERLPEIDEDGYSKYVLVSFSNYSLPCIGQLRKTDGENHWYEGDDEKALDSFGLHVNAWMPLPEPYKAESEGEN